MTTSLGGIGQALEFRPDGSYVSAITVMIEAAYRMEQGRLFVADNETTLRTQLESRRVEVRRDVLLLTGPDGKTMRKERIGPLQDKRLPIVGVWRYRHYTGGMAFERYTARGRLLFRLPMTSDHGCYALDAGRLRLYAADPSGAIFTPHLDGDRLELGREGKESLRFRRAPAAWYPRDTIDYKTPSP